VSLQNGSTLVADHSDFAGAVWEGEGNLSVAPTFVNAAENDFRLTQDSPLLRAGRDGAALGTRFPVGAPMAASHPGFSSVERLEDGQVRVTFWVDAGKTYSLLTFNADDPQFWWQWLPGPRFEGGDRPHLEEFLLAGDAPALFLQLLTPAR
jgi:hypothetical protein